MKDFTLMLSRAQVGIVLEALGDMPLKKSGAVFHDIMEQVGKQNGSSPLPESKHGDTK